MERTVVKDKTFVKAGTPNLGDGLYNQPLITKNDYRQFREAIEAFPAVSKKAIPLAVGKGVRGKAFPLEILSDPFASFEIKDPAWYTQPMRGPLQPIR